MSIHETPTTAGIPPTEHTSTCYHHSGDDPDRNPRRPRSCDPSRIDRERPQCAQLPGSAAVAQRTIAAAQPAPAAGGGSRLHARRESPGFGVCWR
ncbi:hypothetical protein PG985_003277 [Apiospora marii]|uniref:Uncharacterized protein n=1 Tax=Apiospora marii TaxID=335849 RepID=A0ABR1RV60_9PEZI